MYSIIYWNIARFFLVMFAISQLGNLSNHYQTRRRAYSRAQTHLQTEVCTNPRVRAELGEYSRCEESEETMGRPPLFTAIVDTAEDIHICGNGYCSMLGVNITNALPQVIITMGIIAVIILWASGIQLRRNRDRNSEKYWSLPEKREKRE